MEIHNEITTMLDLMPQPAFFVRDGMICHHNTAAHAYLIRDNTPISLLIGESQTDYCNFHGGCMALTLQLEGQPVPATITQVGDFQLFTLPQQNESAQLQAFALSAVQLREAMLSNSLEIEQLLSQLPAKLKKHCAPIRQNSHQLLRLVCNMSDAWSYSQGMFHNPEYVEMCAFVEELMERVAWHTENTAISFRWELPNETVGTMADRTQIERALLNMIANAIKYADRTGEILIQLTCQKNRLRLSVIGPSNLKPDADIYTRFQRQPQLEDPRHGIGLGMAIIRAVAAAHNGTVLLDTPEDGKVRISLSLPIRKINHSQVHTPRFHMDYACDRDHVLLELSDLLPAAAYKDTRDE